MTTRIIGAALLLWAVLVGERSAVAGEVQETTMPSVIEGKKIYVKHCVGCHGIEGKGDGYKLLGADPAMLTAPSIQKKSDEALLKTIHEGKAIMPPWNVRLSEQEERDVLAYIRTLRK
ncbi:MAG: cytochrome c [Nitrospira sp.]|nr:cytochrome c [Nitrospira sp.]